MSEDRQMNINTKESPKNCGRCGHLTMTIDGSRQCPNCITENEPKTGHTIIIDEPKGEKGPVTIRRVTQRDQVIMEAEAVLEARKKGETVVVVAPAPGTVAVNVPVTLFPDLVMWARKLKLPKDWKEAEKIKAITEFQIEINSKLGGLK
jgi:hypothetical protein